MSVLADLKGELGYYANMLMWTTENDVVKASPKRQLSNLSQKVITRAFKHFGGAYVSKEGKHYFELVLAPQQLSPSNRIAVAYSQLMKEGIFKETNTI